MGARALRTWSAFRTGFHAPTAVALFIIGLTTLQCQSSQNLTPPQFEYGRLSDRYFRTNPQGHFPLTIQRGSNLQPVTSLTGHMFYTSNVLGSGDIWIRDLGKTVNVPLVKHPAEQYKPAITPAGDRLIFVSEDQNPRGDLRLLTIDPAEIIQNTLDGVPPQDLWDQSTDLSVRIEELAAAQNMDARCLGQAAETDPVWNHNGTLLAFATDRCNPGDYDVWMLEVEESTPIRLVRLTTGGGVQPRFGPESGELVFVSYRSSPGGSVFMADLNQNRLVENSLREIPLPRSANQAKAGAAFIYTNPILTHRRGLRDDQLRPGMTLFYTSIRSDTNRNNRIDTSDNGAVFAYDLPTTEKTSSVTSEERQLLDESANLLSVNHSDMIGGVLLYAARLYNSVNVYFLRPRGIIPLEPDIHRQYELRNTYVEKNPGRYLLALDAVEAYFGDQKEWLIYQGRVDQDRLRYYESRSLAARADEIRRRIQDHGERNPFARLQARLAGLSGADADQTPTLINQFIESIRADRSPYKTEAEARTVLAAAYQTLAEFYNNRNRHTEALSAVKFLNESYADYQLRDATMLQQARLELTTNLARIKQAQNLDDLKTLPLIPDVYPRLLGEVRSRGCAPAPTPTAEDSPTADVSGDQCRRDVARTLELIHTDIYNFFYEQRSPDEALELADFTLGREKNTGPGALDPFIRSTLLTIRARAMYDDKRYLDALNESVGILSQIPPGENGAPADGWRSIYIRNWQITSYVQEQLGNFSEAYAAKLNFGGAYSRETAVSIDTQDFVDIIEESEGFINLYLRTARNISATVKENETVLLGATIGAAIDAVTNAPIDIGGTEMDVLNEFCLPSSRNRVLFLSLGPSYDERYVNFCQSNYEYIDARNFANFPMKSARTAADLLYIASYANASILNIMFLNIKKLGVLTELYNERAVYYQRLKIDIAAEKNERLLESRARDLLVLDQSDLVDLVSESDPYDSRTYDELIYGFRTALPQASDIGDLSLFYGYAYILIKKNTEREAFYEKLQNTAYAQKQGITGLRPGGVSLPQSLLIEKKEEILRDFKHADYLLQYILNVDPLNVDAYLLQGWLYQYIDERRTKKVQTVPTFIENIYYYVTRSQPAAQSDGRFYADLYKNYFPENLYESNVELFRQALQKVEGDASDQATGNLHLNLANNYFKLLNFQRAIEHYKKAEDYVNRAAKAAQTAPFDNYRRHALFHFNMGRALFYEGRLDEAASRLQKAYDIYDEFERKPLHERFSTLNFMLATSQNDATASTNERRIQRSQIKDILEQSEEVRVKMALIAAMIGLAHWEAGRPDEAVLFYQDAILRLYENADGNASDSTAAAGAEDAEVGGIAVVERASLMNFIALAHQSQRNFAESDARARQAGLYARDRGLIRNDLRYEPQTLGGRALGCILPYGEDFSVIGEGRTPYGFSPLRQYHLSLGVQLENRIQQGDLEGASYLLRQRRQAFQARDMDVRLGRQGFVATLNQEALNEYRAEEFDAAAAGFREAAERSREFDFLQSFRQNYYNYFKALFAGIEAAEIQSDDSTGLTSDRKTNEAREAAEARIVEGLEEIETFREEYRDELRDQFIAARTAEVPDYEYNEERDGPALLQKLNQQLLDILSIEGTLYFYLGRLRMGAAQSAAALDLAYADLGRSIKLYDEALGVIQSANEGGQQALRIRLNRARALRQAGRLIEARIALRGIIEDAYEFNLIREEWLAHGLLARVQDELHTIYGDVEDQNQAADHYTAAAALLATNPQMYGNIRRHANPFFDSAADFFTRAGRPDTALELLERRWENYLAWQFYRNPLGFKDRAFQRDYDLVREARARLRLLDDSESALRMERKSFAKITERKIETRNAMSAALERMATARPRFKTFAGVPRESKNAKGPAPTIRNDQTVVRLFYFPGEYTAADPESKTTQKKANTPSISAWCFRGASMRFTQTPIEAGANKGSFAEGLQNALKKIGAGCFAGGGDRFVIPDPRLYGLDVAGLLSTDGRTRPAYSTRLSDDFVGFLRRGDEPPTNARLNVFNLRTGLVYNSDQISAQHADIVGLRAWETNALFPAGENLLFDPRAWVSSARYTSLAFVSRVDSEETRSNSGRAQNYRRDAGIYEVLRATGTGTVAFISTSADDDEDNDALADVNRVDSYTAPGAAPRDPNSLTPEQAESEENLSELRTEQPGRAVVHEILSSRGRTPYTNHATNVFGSSGHQRQYFYDELLKDHVTARQAAEAAENDGDLERARIGYALAESYLQAHPRESELRFENDLGQARLQIRENRDNRGDARTSRFDAMLETYAKNSTKLPRVYDTAIETLLTENLSHVAKKYLNAYIERFPERKAEIIRKNGLLSFRARLKAVEYGEGRRENQTFARDFEDVRRQILASPDAIEFVDELIKHTQYEVAGDLATELERRGSTRSAAVRAAFENDADRYLLDAAEPNRSRPPVLASGNAGGPDILSVLNHSFRGDWAAYETLASSIQEDLRRRNELALAKFRARLFEQWRLYRTQQPVNILDISNVTLQAGKSAYTSVSRLERGMIFELLIGNIAADPELQIARMLESLIDVERKVSLNRAGRMALGGGESFLRLEDLNSARRYLQTCVDLADDTIPNANLSLRRARLGTALQAGGLVDALKNNQTSWQLEESADARARRDSLWRERLIKDWQRTLTSTNEQFVLELYESLPRKFATEEFDRFQNVVSESDRVPVLRQEIPNAIAVLKARALAAENWAALTEIGFYQQEYRNYLTGRELGHPVRPPVYSPITPDLLKQIPAGQNFVALLDTPDEAIRVTYRDRTLQGVRLKATGRYLRGRMHQYLIRQRTGNASEELREELSRQYRALFGLGQSGITYYWLSDIHALAPILPERGDRLFQILNPRTLADRAHPTLVAGWEFAEDFRVRLVEPENARTAARPNYRGSEEALFYERLETMERLSVGAASSEVGIPRQFQALATTNAMPRLDGQNSDASAWFFSGNRLTLDPTNEIAAYNYLLAYLGAKLQGPGVVTIRMPTSLDHARFLRQYYSRSNPARSIYRRYLSAMFNLRREGTTGGDFQYRLTTANFLKE